MESVTRYIDENRQRYIDELKEFVGIPSVSTLPEARGEVFRAADFVKRHLEAAGLDVRVMPTKGFPVVYAEWTKKPNAPTVLVYGHYDVQPPDPIDKWRHGPFSPTIEGDDLIGRGATDDKGQVFAHVKAVEAWFRAGGEPPVNVKFCIEGEEEIGSPNLDAFVHENKDLLACDMVVVSDSSQLGPGRPAITYGLRGLVYMEVKITGPDHDLHSGSYGGMIENPGRALARLVASFHDKDGRVTIPGFYKDVVELTPAERSDFKKLAKKDAEYMKEIGAPKPWGEKGYTILERVWARPTCEINGLYGGFMGTGAKTVIPSQVGVKVSMRLVANQDPEKIVEGFKAHVAKTLGNTVTYEILRHSASAPVLVPRSGPAAEVAMKATERGFGARPYFIREGGSIPVVLTFNKVLNAPVSLLGFGLPDDRAHSPNEKFHLPDFQRGILTSAYVLEEAANVPKGGFAATGAPATKAPAARRTTTSKNGRAPKAKVMKPAARRAGGAKNKKSKKAAAGGKKAKKRRRLAGAGR